MALSDITPKAEFLMGGAEMRCLFSFSLSIILAAMLPSSLHASQTCPPSDFLKDEVNFSNSSELFKLAYVEKMSKEKFEELKKSGGLSAFIPMIDTSVSLSYDDFKKVTSIEKLYRNLDITSLQESTLFRSRLSSVGNAAYVECLKSSSVGLQVTAPEQSATSEEFLVSIRWSGPVGTSGGVFDVMGPAPFVVLGGELKDRDFWSKMTEIKNGQTLKVAVKRSLNEDFYFTASVNGYSDELNLPKKPGSSVLKYDIAVSKSVQSDTGHDKNYNDEEHETCLHAEPNEIFLPSTARVVDDRWIGEDRGRVWSKLKDGANERHICVVNHAHVSRKGIGALVQSHVEVWRITLPQ